MPIRLVLPFVVALALSPSIAASQRGAEEIVELRSGSFVRGTIVERVAGSHLVIQTAGGELRRIDLDDVTYAGPVEGRTRRADGSPASALASPVAPIQASPIPDAAVQQIGAAVEPDVLPASAPPGAVAVQVRTRGPRTGMVLHVMMGSVSGSVSAPGSFLRSSVTMEAFRPLCISPCTVALDPGAYVFGVSYGDRRATRIPGLYQVSDGMTLEIHPVEHGAERAIGVITLLAGLGGGAALALWPLAEGVSDPLPTLIAGAILGGLSLLVGIPLVAMSDGILLHQTFDRRRTRRR